jgi:DNA repair exonuclease SbcCD ATPase subunit
MAHTAVNTLEYVEDLEQAGVQSAQARAMAKALDKVLVAHLATKTDVAEAKSDLEIRIGEVRTELAETRSELKTEIGAVRSELKTEIGAVRSELKTEIGAVRSELKTDIADVNTRLGALEVRVDALPHRLGWRLLGGVAVLHAIAVAFLRLV